MKLAHCCIYTIAALVAKESYKLNSSTCLPKNDSHLAHLFGCMDLQELYLGRRVPLQVALIALEAKQPGRQGTVAESSCIRDIFPCGLHNADATPPSQVSQMTPLPGPIWERCQCLEQHASERTQC